MADAPPPATSEPTRRIAAVVEETGVAKEVVHHYLREGVLPPAPARGRYTDRQVRLLRQVRTLREEHKLPLDVVRRVFARFEFDPAPIESLTLSESLCTRMTRLGAGEALLSARTLSAGELAAEAGVGPERVAEYVEARLLVPFAQDGAPRFTVYDRNVVALCERALQMGTPFDSFRTVASYVRVAFELERGAFFRVGLEGHADLAADLFVRREVASSLVQNVLSSAIEAHLRSAASTCAPRTLDDVIYQPSAAFVRRHGLDAEVDAARARLADATDDPDRWREAAVVMMHAGRAREAAFVLEEGASRWPEDARLRQSRQRARLLLGEPLDAPPEGPKQILLAAARRMAEPGSAEGVRRDVLSALESLPSSGAAESRMLAGWLLTALPPLFNEAERGRELLASVLASLDGAPESVKPGRTERLQVNTAYLLHEALGRDAEPDLERRAELRDLICRTDPASRFAEAVFLAHPTDRRSP